MHILAAARVVRQAALEQPPAALRLSGGMAAVLGSSGVAGQRLGQPAASKPRETGAVSEPTQQTAGSEAATSPELPPAFKQCAGLGGSSIMAAAFDVQHPNRAYAVATNGSVLALAVGGERGAPHGCTVRSAARLPPGLVPPQQPGTHSSNVQRAAATQQAAVQLAVLPGYLVAAAGGQLAVFNVTAAPRSPPRLLLLEPLAALGERFGVVAAAAGAQAAAPLLATSRQGQHAAVMLNATVLAVYEASFPYRPPRQPHKGALAWMQVRGSGSGRAGIAFAGVPACRHRLPGPGKGSG